MKFTKAGREAEAKAKRAERTENLKKAAKDFNEMTPAQKKAARNWGKKNK